MEETKEVIIEEQEDSNVDDERIEVNEPYGFIYITTNLINGVRYLGQKSFSQKNWKTYLGSGIAFKNALKKYGKKNFKRDIILVCYSEDELNTAEYKLSVFFDVVESDDWYNLALGGGTTRGWHPSRETKDKISEAAKERLSDPTKHPCYGKPGLSGEKNSQFGVSPRERMDEETYNQWYEKHKVYWENPSTKGKHIWADKPNPNLGKAMSEEQKKKISESKIGKYTGENASFYGKHHTDEAKEKMSRFRSSPSWWKCRTVYCIELNELFWSAEFAHKKYGVDSSGIIACCKGKRKSAGKHPVTGEKLHWLYAEDAVRLGHIGNDDLVNYLDNLK